MAQVQIRSVEQPFERADPHLVQAALHAILLADAMGLLAAGEPVGRLDLPTLRRVARAAAEAGIGSSAVTILSRRGQLGSSELTAALVGLGEALEQSPAPRFEWKALVDLFGVERLSELTAISPASLRRYASGSRPTPDDVAARIHLLARAVADLKGGYNEIGIRRWFERKRTLLKGRSPQQLLKGKWDSEDSGPRRVLELARSLASSSAS